MSITKQDAERFYSKATKEFDRWFKGLPRAEQDTLRRQGVIPYKEMPKNEYVFPVNTRSETQLITSPWDVKGSMEQDTFYSREKVEEFTRRLLTTLEYSHSPEVRLHFQIVRLALRLPDAMDGKQLARVYGLTKAGINFRVQRMRAIMAGTQGKESPKRGGISRVAPHRGKKTRGTPAKPRDC